MTIVPVFQSFLLDHGITWLGTQPDWALGPVLPGGWLLPLQTLIVLGGFAGSLVVGQRIGRRDFDSPAAALLSLLPWVAVLLGLAIAALATFNLPMEMRGTIFPGG